jgi:hypothetical protein
MKTTVNGKEIKLVTRNDISNIVSQKVAEMLTQGFNFCFYSGSQGEEGKVCLTPDEGKTVYIFWIHKEWEKVSDDGWEMADVMYITGKKYSDVYKNQTLWFSEGELFFEKKWFKLDSKEERYVENLEDWKILDNIHSDRRHLHYEMSDRRNTVKLPAKLHKIALKVIKNKKGYKSVSLKDIESVTRRLGGHYTFNFTKESRKESCTATLKK